MLLISIMARIEQNKSGIAQWPQWMITMAGDTESQDGLANKLFKVGSSLGWFERPVDELIAKVGFTYELVSFDPI